MNTASNSLYVMLEGVLWEPGSEWRLALDSLAARFRRVRELDAVSLHDVPVETAMERLGAWAQDDIDLGRELERFFDEHASIHVRPDPQMRRGLALLAQQTSVYVVTSLPASAAVALLRHLGLARSCTVAAQSPDRDRILTAPTGRRDLLQQFTTTT